MDNVRAPFIIRQAWTGHVRRDGSPATHAEFVRDLEAACEQAARSRDPLLVSYRLMLQNVEPEDSCTVCVAHRMSTVQIPEHLRRR